MWSSAKISAARWSQNVWHVFITVIQLTSHEWRQSRIKRLVTVQWTSESEQEEQNKVVDFWSLRVISAPSHFCYMACFETAVPAMTGWSANSSPHLEAGIEEKCVLSKRKQNGFLGGYCEIKLIRFECWDESCNMYGSDIWIYRRLIQ